MPSDRLPRPKPGIACWTRARLLCLLLALVALAQPGCNGPAGGGDRGRRGEDRTRGDRGPEKAVPVRVERAFRGPISQSIETTGDLVAEDWAEVVARRSGIVEALLADEGTIVRKGDALLELDQVEARIAYRQALTEATEAERRAELSEAQVEDAVNDVAKAKLAETKAENEYDRYARLSPGVIQQEELETRRYDRERTKMERIAAENALAQARINAQIAKITSQTAKLRAEKSKVDLDWTTVRAPFAGVISMRHVQRGQYLAANTPAFTVVDAKRLKLEVNLPQRYLTRLQPGLKVELETEAFPGAPFPSVLRRVSPVVGEKGTVKVTIGVRQQDVRLRPGMYVAARIILDTRERALLASKRAVIYGRGEEVPYVFVATPAPDEATARDASGVRAVGDRVNVRVGYRTATHLEIIPLPTMTTPRALFPYAGGGLAAFLGSIYLPGRFATVREGDRLIVAGQDNMKGGEAVKIVEDDGRTEAAEAPPEASPDTDAPATSKRAPTGEARSRRP